MIPNDALEASTCQSGYKDGIFNSSFYSSTSVAATLKNMDCVKCDGLQSWYKNCTETGMIVCLYCNAAMDGSRHWRATTHKCKDARKERLHFKMQCDVFVRTVAAHVDPDKATAAPYGTVGDDCRHSYCSECAQRQMEVERFTCSRCF